MPALPAPALDGLSFAAFRHPDAIEPDWRALERTGLGTPYQRFDWVRAWFAAREGDGSRDGRGAILLASDRSHAPVVLLPVDIVSRGPARIARFAGGKHANFGMPWLDRSFARRCTPAQAEAVLAGLAGAHGGIDLVALMNQPVERDGCPNPFARLSQSRPPAEPAFATLIRDEGAGVVERVVSQASRRKYARKSRRLAERGAIAFRRAADAGEVEAVLAAFFRQKALRCAAKRIPNPFATACVQAFIRDAALNGLDRGEPGLELHALWCGDDVLATFGAACDGAWLCGAFLSHEPDPAIERDSPGELLLVEVLRDAGRRGLARFDLGVGGGAYKASFCRDLLPLADTLLPMTWIGRAAAPLLGGAGRLKAAVKTDPRLAAVARRLRPVVDPRQT